MTDLTPKLRAFCAESEEVRGYAQRGFVAYCRCVYMAKDKKTFQISNYKLEKYAASLGLAKSPRLRFLERDKKVMTAMKGNSRFHSCRFSSFLAEHASSDESDDEDMFTKRKADISINEDDDRKIELDLAEKEKSKTVSKAKQVTKAIRAKKSEAKKIVFDEEGNEGSGAEEQSDDDFNLEDATRRLRQGK